MSIEEGWNSENAEESPALVVANDGSQEHPSARKIRTELKRFGLERYSRQGAKNAKFE